MRTEGEPGSHGGGAFDIRVSHGLAVRTAAARKTGFAWQACIQDMFGWIDGWMDVSMKVCKYASVQVCKYAIIRVCKHIKIKVCKDAV